MTLLVKQFLFKELSSVEFRPIDRTLSGATTLSQSGRGGSGCEAVLRIPQSTSLSRTSPSDFLVS